MVDSKAWNWNKADKDSWLEPCEEAYYLAEKWKKAGIRSVLDLGCGRGRHAVYFAKQGFEVTAVDLSEEAVFYAKEWQKREHIDFLCQKADMLALPFPDAAFDAVFSYHVISHTDTEGIRVILKELTRVLKPDGRIFMTLCSKAHDAFLDESNVRVDENTVKKTERAEQDVPHFFVDEEMIFALLEGFEIESLRHICECGRVEPVSRHKCHYYIEAVVKSRGVHTRAV